MKVAACHAIKIKKGRQFIRPFHFSCAPTLRRVLTHFLFLKMFVCTTPRLSARTIYKRNRFYRLVKITAKTAVQALVWVQAAAAR
jgi:hypothetical protein